MFLPSSNRLAGFLEISALSIHLAQSGGTQYKAGYLQIVSSGNKGTGFGRKSASRAQKRKQRWCAVRESYLVAVEESGELAVWDVFLLDADFKIERPTRYYRQGLNLLHGDFTRDSDASKSDPTGSTVVRSGDSTHADRNSLFGSIRSHVSHILRRRHDASHRGPGSGPDGERENHVLSDTEADSLDPDSRPPTPILDPSTNTYPSNDNVPRAPRHQEDEVRRKKERTSDDVSRHTFYIENSQMRLKLHARNEVRLCAICLQWRPADKVLKALTCVIASDAAVDCRARESCGDIAFHRAQPV
jgi:phospholipase D1/2